MHAKSAASVHGNGAGVFRECWLLEKPRTRVLSVIWQSACREPLAAAPRSVYTLRRSAGALPGWLLLRHVDRVLLSGSSGSLMAYREQIAVNAASYLRTIQFCQLFGHFEWSVGLLCEDVRGILGSERLGNTGALALNPKWYLNHRLDWLRKAVPTLSPQSFESELPRVTELRNAIMHDGGLVGEFKQSRLLEVEAYLGQHQNVGKIENHELHLTDAAIPHFEKWFGDAFYSLEQQVMEALNGMEWRAVVLPTPLEIRRRLVERAG
jgi:hypothetical protein